MKKRQQDAVFSYTKSDFVFSLILSGVLSIAMLFACSLSVYWQSSMTIPIIGSLIIYLFAITCIVTPIKYLRYVDNRVGVEANWLNGVCTNAIFLNLIYVLPMLILITGIMTASCKATATAVYKELETGSSIVVSSEDDTKNSEDTEFEEAYRNTVKEIVDSTKTSLYFQIMKTLLLQFTAGMVFWTGCCLGIYEHNKKKREQDLEPAVVE